mmetsp:Transcript_53193/g.119927  ORF Transcript_53193/g.119927 Transcript_53193/m.119927 type:complete len:203 (+) Transcript_53193:67-675(+)|eukprot:CAMPEP_0197901068 /NCGR_PEP_ID=MMETSP1439-20131203/50609_1 /TAXON_ID=66791 /ORGANISM="Gonyaulax spinifera, Strain CCMP409" /LENGTH=202 /DNA_ID=CAMNT_0043522021 /DNA_START=67 /DNA_END=675 /DNA_ORIENTATION=-
MSEESPEARKYRFGDLTRGVSKRLSGVICEKTGKEKYRFGDATRVLLRGRVAAFTGKEDYTPGDITKEIVARIEKGDIDLSAMSGLLGGLLEKTDDISGVAPLFTPEKAKELVEYNLQQGMKQGEDMVAGALAEELDERIKNAAGAKAVDGLKTLVCTLTKKEKYEFGDATKFVMARVVDAQESGDGGGSGASGSGGTAEQK